MIEIKELSFILLIVDQFVDHDTIATGNEQQSTNTDDLMHMMKFVPFTSVFNRPIYTIQQRDLSQIRRQLNRENYILTPVVYQATTNMIYVCKQNEINEKVTEYMKQTKAYMMIDQFNENNLHRVQICLQQFLCQQIKNQLDVLYNEQCINAFQYVFLLNRNGCSNVQLDQLLCFIPNLRKHEIPFEPMMISNCGPTANITEYLYDLIAPIYYGSCAAHQRTFFGQGNDALQAIELYHRQGLLRPTTFFATIEIHHLSTILPHTHMMKIFECFLKDSPLPNSGYIQGLSIEAILKLVHFVLSHQYFLYQNKFYQQIKGGGPSRLTRLLADIYLFYWQKPFVSILNQQKEIFGRCFDQMFLTWNQSKAEFINLINTISHRHSSMMMMTTTPPPPPLKLISTIGSTVNYLDVTISHLNGVLQTKVFHPSLFESYSLPSMTTAHRPPPPSPPPPDYPYFTLIRAALLRAVRYCTHVHDFETESHFIRLSLLLNHFSANDIKQSFELFETEFKLTTKSFRYCQQDYHQFRERIRKNLDQNGMTTTTFNQQSSPVSIDDQENNLRSSSKRIKLIHQE